MSAPDLDHSHIASRIPHAGSMCLLEAVKSWDADQIVATAISHCDGDHPLRCHGRLGIAAGIEYAAQAMAVHGSLLAESANAGKPPPGFLASARNVAMHVRWLDDAGPELRIDARRIASDAAAIVYSFELRADARLLLSGRASVMLLPGR